MNWKNFCMQVRDIPCGTKGGVMITFDKIEVKKLHQYMLIRVSFQSSFPIMSVF